MNDRSYPDRPIVAVGAVIVHQGRALIVERGEAPRKGEWTVPGGMLELGETLRAGVEREVLEETGLVVHAGPVIDVYENLWPDAEGRVQYHYVLVDFLCALAEGESQEALRPATDASAARWIAPEELTGLPLIGKTAEAIRKAFLMNAQMKTPQDR